MRKFLLVALFLLLLCVPSRISAEPVSSSTPVGTAAQHKIYSTATTIKTIAGIASDIGATSIITADIYGTLSYGSATTITENITLDLTHGMIDCNSVASAVIIRGAIVAPRMKQIFTNCPANSIVFSQLAAPLIEAPVSWWGAKAGDGVDDTVAVQAAIKASTSGRTGPVVFPPGQFDISAALTFSPKDYMVLQGANTGDTTLMGTSATGNVITMTGRNIRIEHLTIDGNATRQGGATGHGIFGKEDLGGVQAFILLHDVVVTHQPQDGINIDSPELNHYENVDSHANGRYGINWVRTAPGRPFHNVVINTRVRSNINSGFLCDGCVGNTFINLEAWSNGGTAQVDLTGTDAWNNTFIDPDVENQAQALNQAGNNIGIRLAGLGNHVIGGHISALVTGISLVNCDGCVIEHPLCINSKFADPGGFSMDACVKLDAVSSENSILVDDTGTGITASYSINASSFFNDLLIGGKRIPGSAPQASLGTPANGTVAYCTDCTIANPCAGGGTGALAKRLNNTWICN